MDAPLDYTEYRYSVLFSGAAKGAATSFLSFGYKKTAVKCSIFTTVCFKFYLVLGITIQNKL